MSLIKLKKYLKVGKVYRRSELANWSKSIDRHLELLLKEETLQRLYKGIYYFPGQSVFGKTPPSERELLTAFLQDEKFLITSFNVYNRLGVGTTQLYNEAIVYNHKRIGIYKLGNRLFHFRIKKRFPKKLTEEFLLIDLVNNIDNLAEDRNQILENVFAKVKTLNKKKLILSVDKYANSKSKKLLGFIFHI